MGPVRSFAAAVAILTFASVAVFAQPIISAKSGVIAGIEGKVLIDNQEVQPSVTHFPEVKENSVLSTAEGRVELMLPPGFMLRMGENGALKMLANRLIDTRVEMQAGAAVVEVDQTKQDYNVTIALKNGLVTLSKVGVYRFDSEPARLKVFHGAAMVHIGEQDVMVVTGKMLGLDGQSASAEKFDVEQTDALDNWSRRRAEAMAVANISGAKYSGDNSAPARTSSWTFNPYFGMYTYVPWYGSNCNPFYGVCYYSPMAAYQNYWMPYGQGRVPASLGALRSTGTAATSGPATERAPSFSAARVGSGSSMPAASAAPSPSSSAASSMAVGGRAAAPAAGRR
jgi:hypothetical protein